ncbi:MAG: 23S rRNA (guanosine(2251)-2'-O)-methyltransferase RlmB [Actinomycetota bacterium]|nr:MAG: 23S rRNA (guanosine(2251)-2'-O)-methyltransferase RlmB [Actinomycetota bacterium]
MAKGRRTSTNNPRLNPSKNPRGYRRVAALGEKGAFVSRDRSLGGEQVEGRQAVRELLVAANRKVKEIWLSDSVERVGIIEEILDKALDRRVPVRTVSRTRLDGTAGSEGSQGIIAFAEKLHETHIGDLIKAKNGVKPFLVVVDGVTDPYNLGAILRSAECAGVTGVILPEHRSVHITPAASKSAAGAIEYLRFALVPGVPNALQELSRAGVWCVGLDSEGSQSIYEVSLYDQPVALVFGAEGRGISSLAKQRCDIIGSIPQFGHIPSLNVSNAAALAMFEVARARASSQ